MPYNVWVPKLTSNPGLCNKSLRARYKVLKNITTTFVKSSFLAKYGMRYAIYMPPNTKDLAINQAMFAY